MKWDASCVAALNWRNFRWFFFSVRFRLVILVLLVFTPAFALLLYVADRERQDGKDDVREKALHFARLASAEQAQIVQEMHTLLRHLAMAPEVLGVATANACNDLMAREIKLRPHLDNLGALGLDGIRYCSVLLPEQRIDLSDRLYFRRAVATRDFSIGDHQIGRSSRKASIGFGYPVLDAQGAVRGVVYGTLNLDWLGQSLVRKQLPADAVLSVVDNKGIILARFPDKEELTGKFISSVILREMVAHRDEGTIDGTGIAGSALVWGYVPLLVGPSGTLIVRVSVPVATAFAHVERTYYRNLTFIVVVALGVLFLAWFGGEKLIMRPLKSLSETARRLGHGEYAVRTDVKYTTGELGELASVFDSMAQGLQDRDIELRSAMAELQVEATVDSLTGLYNRRYLWDFLRREMLRAQRARKPVAAIMLDIDHFKRFNDTWGHQAGDLVLQRVAEVLRNTIRGSDIACRYGGEELVVILADAMAPMAEARAETMRNQIEAMRLEYAGKPLALVTASFGVAVYPEHAGNAEALVAAADKAMYAAKEAGRNRVQLSSVITAPVLST